MKKRENTLKTKYEIPNFFLYLILFIFFSPIQCLTNFPNLGTILSNPATHRSQYPYIAGDSYRALADHIADTTTFSWPLNKKLPFNPNSVKDGDIVFVHFRTPEGPLWFNGPPDFSKYYFETIHPLIKSKYILITHHDDCCTPGKYKYILDDEKIIAWFTINWDGYKHPKIYPIPYGIANSYFPWGNTQVLTQMIKQKNQYKKNILLYMNFNPVTNPPVRNKVLIMFSNKDFCKHATQRSYQQYLTDLAESKFVLSPVGNGLDCYRNTESILMGCIPILQKTTISFLYEDLPALIVEDWSTITEDFLNNKYKEISKKWHMYNFEKLYMDHWIKIIKNKQQPYREK